MRTESDPLVRLSALAREQAALRRVATLVARDAEPERIFEAVCEEVGCILGVETTNLVRYDDAGTATILGAWSEEGAPVFPVTEDVPMNGETVAPQVLRSGRPVRVDDYTDLRDELAGRLRAVGISSAVGAPVVVAGRLWGAIIAASSRPGGLAADAEERLSGFGQLITDALASADAREQLAASRTRILRAGYEERVRLGRDLHDGAQQELVSVVISLQLAQKRWERDPTRARALVEDALDHAQTAVEELRNLAAGIHPSVLSDRGLAAALETLADRSPVPVELDTELEERLPMPVETTAYFVVAEALTNVAKYADAGYASVTARVRDGRLAIDVRDDGVGGADARDGSGLRGLADRVSALHGALNVCSPPGRGTHLHVDIAVN
jgi:signal transduction histidine kinase